MGRRIGVYGGTFNPPHVGHLLVAEQAQRCGNLDLVLFVPGGTPGHREAPQVTGSQRLAMVQAMIGDNPLFETSDIDVKRVEPTYTYDTINDLQKLYLKDELFFICGTDCLEHITSWKHSDRLAKMVPLLVVGRNGYGKYGTGSAVDEHGFDVTYCEPVSDLSMSSTQVRDAVAKDKLPSGWLVPPVQQYIEEHRLYRQ